MRYEDLLNEAETLGAHVRERHLNGLSGCYYERMRLIIVDENMPDYEKYCTLVHELVHARYHDPGCGPQYAKSEHRARKEAALRLIDPIAYATAERIYEGDSFLIAQALNRTVQVIDDYKTFLHEAGM